MKRFCILIAVCALFGGCDKASRSITGPDLAGVTPAGSYSLTGVVQDLLGAPIGDATVTLASGQNPIRTTVSDAAGRYRFEDVKGAVILSVSKSGYGGTVTESWITEARTMTLILRLMVPLNAGTTLHSKVQDPPCDSGWDPRALCQQISFTPPETGTYELVLTWSGPIELDLLVDGQFFEVSNVVGRIRATLWGLAGVQQEIRIHAYYGQQDFELTASRAGGVS